MLFWNAPDLEGKLADFQTYYNAARSHTSLTGNTPLGVTVVSPIARAELERVRWVSHCRGLVQLPVPDDGFETHRLNYGTLRDTMAGATLTHRATVEPSVRDLAHGLRSP